MKMDLRKYARNTNKRMLAGFIALLLIIGDGLIYLIYGQDAAIVGFICILAGLFPLVLIALSMWIMGKILERYRED